jgi:hypothetical protein
MTLLPSEEGVLRIYFFVLKIPTAKFGTKGQQATSRPPKQLDTSIMSGGFSATLAMSKAKETFPQDHRNRFVYLSKVYAKLHK